MNPTQLLPPELQPYFTVIQLHHPTLNITFPFHLAIYSVALTNTQPLQAIAPPTIPQKVDPLPAQQSHPAVKKNSRVTHCKSCRNHEVTSLITGHMKICKFKECPCKTCVKVRERNKRNNIARNLLIRRSKASNPANTQPKKEE